MLQKAKEIASYCSCGQKHTITTSLLECCGGATDMMLSHIKKNYPPQSALVVCDENTEKYANVIVTSLGCDKYVNPGGAHADEVSTSALKEYISQHERPSLMIACGSGSVHDITRFCAHELGVGFISYPTAASVDGFVSGVAAMTMYGQKLTYPSSSPTALFAEPEVFSSAPKRLTASGVGDMIGKLTALFDWQVAHVLTGEALCPEIYSLMSDALSQILSAAKSDGGADCPEFPVLVMNGLLLSGLAMQLAGNSRPASGAEHHMSHLWEMHVINDPTDALHGEKVGVGTVIVLPHIKSNAKMLREVIDIDVCKIFSASNLASVFGPLTDGIIKENMPNGADSSVLSKLTKSSLRDNAEKIGQLIDGLPKTDEIVSVLSRVGAPTTLPEIGLPDSGDFIKRSLLYSTYVRNRLTFSKIISAVRMSEEDQNT